MKMETNILENSKMEICTEKVNLYKQTGQDMRESFTMTKDMEVEYLLRLMEKNLKVNLKKIKNMDSVLKYIQMEKNMWEISKTGKKMEKVLFPGMMEMNIQENF